MQQLTATGSYTDGSSADLTSLVTWTSSAISKANVDASGVVTGVAAGSASITATLNSVSGSTTVTVTAPSITAISVSPDGLTLPLNVTQQFVATASYSDGSSQDLVTGVAWSSSATSVATIDNNGLASLLTAGTVTITAQVGSLTDTATITIVGAHLTSIAISPATPTMAAGTEQQFTATGSFDDGSTQVLPTVQWTSTSSNILAVSSSGLGTAVAAGNSTLSATSGSITGTTSVTVTNATLVSLAIAPANSSMPIGASKQFTATGTFSDSSTQDVNPIGFVEIIECSRRVHQRCWPRQQLRRGNHDHTSAVGFRDSVHHAHCFNRRLGLDRDLPRESDPLQAHLSEIYSHRNLQRR